MPYGRAGSNPAVVVFFFFFFFFFSLFAPGSVRGCMVLGMRLQVSWWVMHV
jgi:hypothetical protein